MKRITAYKIRTTTYTVLTLLGGFGVYWFATTQRPILVGLSAAFLLVALDNVFCGNHARSAGYNVDKHYVVPPFLRGEKVEE